MSATRRTRLLLGAWSALIVLYAFNPSNVQSWPLDGLSTKWFSQAFHNAAMREALWLSVRAALVATAIAIVLGSAAAFAVHRFRFFGREAVSFVLVLPIALPGIITGSLLAVARAAGETAPLLFTALSNQFWTSDMSQPMASLPVTIFKLSLIHI